MTLASFEDFGALSADYARYHTHPMNRATHAVGIPLIMLAVGWTQPVGALVPWAALAPACISVWSALWRSGCPRSCWEWHLARVLPGWSLWAAFIRGGSSSSSGTVVYEGKSRLLPKTPNVWSAPCGSSRNWPFPVGAAAEIFPSTKG